jgi:M6 family metalloprotease-like protein
LRGLALTHAFIACALLAGGLESSASGQLVVRRLDVPAEARPAAKRAVHPAAPTRDRAARVRATLPPPLAPSGPNAGPAAWLHEMDVRAQRSRAIPDLLSRPGFDWSRFASRRRGWVQRSGPQRNPHTAEAARASAFGPPDTVRIAFIRIDYLHDRGGTLSTGDGKFDVSGPDPNAAPIDPPPHNRAHYLSHLEALRRFYDVMSYGRVVIEGDVWPRTPNGAYSLDDMADFGPWAFSQDIYGAAVDFVHASFFAADSQAKVAFQDTIPWDRYDRFMIIHAGSDFQSDLKQDSPEDMPTFTIGLRPQEAVALSGASRPIDRVCIVPETANQDGFFGAINGLVAHENGHNIFGFADLYDVFTGRPVIGYWSLMDSGNLAGIPFQLPDGSESFAVGLVPPSVDPFQRFFTTDELSFVDVTDDTMAVANSERNPDVRRLFLSSDEYLLLENRAIVASDSIPLDVDTTTKVILGPKFPDRFEYDALLPSIPHRVGTPPLPSGGILAWHIDASTIPFETALRIDPATDYGFNSGPGPPAITIVEADGLDDLGDPSSPFLFGSAYDPYFKSNNRALDDNTEPNLRPHTGTLPHARLEFLDDPGPVMRVSARHDWRVPGWPIVVDFPPGGPQLLAVDADGDRRLEVCWAGGAAGSPDSTALFAVRADGTGLFGSSLAFASLDRRPRPLMAALPIGDQTSDPPDGPSYFAASTYYDASADTVGGSPGGQVWLIDYTGVPLPGWPAALPSPVTTPPVISGLYPTATVWVGCANGKVYALNLDGAIVAGSLAGLPGGITGRLAVTRTPPGFVTPAGQPADELVAAGSSDGEVEVLGFRGAGSGLFTSGLLSTSLGVGNCDPDFLWITFGGAGSGAGASCPGSPVLVVHNADRLWAFCPNGALLPGWGRSVGDTLVAGLGAGDPDGDGFPEVLTQSVTSKVAFWNESGYPSPGWPRATTREGLRTGSPALALDVDGDQRSEIVALDGSGIIAALNASGRTPAGWPLATGAGAVGSPVVADLDRNGSLEVIAPDRFVPDSLRGDINGRFGSLYAYSLPRQIADPVANSWPMVGGDPGRTSALPASRAPSPGAPIAGPLVNGSLHAFPNPARRKPVSFAFELSEPAEVDFTILDASGHEVASFTRSGRRSDNLEVWDPGGVPAGLYLARLRFRGATSTASQVLTLGLLR